MTGKRLQHLFVVRMWAEVAAVSAAMPGSEDWHGLVQHVPTGQKLYFASLADLNSFIEARLEVEPGPRACSSEVEAEATLKAAN